MQQSVRSEIQNPQTPILLHFDYPEVTMKFFTLFIAWAALFQLAAANWTNWRADGKYPAAQFQVKNGIVQAAPGKKGIKFFDSKPQNVSQGMELTLKAAFSGKGTAAAGCHFYDKNNKWLGMATGKLMKVDSAKPVPYSANIVINKANAVRIRPFVLFQSGSVKCHDFELKMPEIFDRKKLAEAPVFRNWMYNRTTKAVAIRMTGDGKPETSSLKIITSNAQTVESYPKTPQNINENDILKIRFKASGTGKFHVGVYLYDAKNVWQGVQLSETITPGKISEVTQEIKTPAGKKAVKKIRPFIRVLPNSNLKIGELQINKRETAYKKPEVEIPLPEGFQLLYPGKADFQLRFFASENKIILDLIETPYASCAGDVCSVKFSAVSSDGKIIGQQTFSYKDNLITNQSFRIRNDFTGSFTVKADYLDKNGKVLISGTGYAAIYHMDLYSGRYMAGGFRLRNAHLKEWVKPRLMGQTVFHKQNFPFEKELKTDHGFAGFTPLKIKGDTIQISGRTYTVCPNGFLSQATAYQLEPTVGNATESLFAAPVNLTVDGVSFPWKRSKLKKNGHAVLWEQKADAAGAVWTIQNRLEPDGVLRMTFTVIPGKNFHPERVSLNLPLKQDQATLYQNITDVTYRKIDRSKKLGQTPLGGFAGYTPSQKIRGDVVWESKGQERKTPGSFQPFVWFGNEDRGFCYFSDSDRDWQVDDSRSALEISRRNGQVIFNINFINMPEKRLSEVMKWDIGLLATPVKAPLKNWRGTIFPRWTTMNKPFYEKLKDVRKIIIVSAGHPSFNSGTQNISALDVERTRKMYRNVADKFGSTYLEYYCSDLLGIAIPEMKTYFSEWGGGIAGTFVKGGSTRWHSKSYDFKGATVIQQQRKVPSYIKYRGWAIGDKLKQIGLLSFYEDNVHPRTFFDPARNYGFKDEKGRMHPEYDFWMLREHYHYLAYQYKKNNLENLTGAHGSASLMIPSLTNCTFFIDGEQPGRYDNIADKDYIDHWKDLDYMRAVSMGRAFGINSIFLSEMIFKGNDEDGHHSRAWLALILPHDIAPWDGSVKNRQPVRLWHKIVNDLRFYADPPRLYPYWAKGKYKVFEHNHKDLLVTVWKQKNRMVIMLSNFGEKGNFTVKLLPGKIGMKSLKKLEDAENQKSLPIRNNTFSVEIPRHDFRILVAE